MRDRLRRWLRAWLGIDDLNANAVQQAHSLAELRRRTERPGWRTHPANAWAPPGHTIPDDQLTARARGHFLEDPT